MCRVFFVLCFFVIFVKVSICLRVKGLSVPALKQVGDVTTLTCEYDLEGAGLYSVKWYRDNEEFYRYMPRLKPPQRAHAIEGVFVDLEKSSAGRVHLQNLTLKSRGLYGCEISAEAPSFQTVFMESFMTVFFFPRESPVILGHRRQYELLEPLDVNCTSPRAYPAPDLHWFIDGRKVANRSWLVPHQPIEMPEGLVMTTLGLRAPAQRRMRLRCVASIGKHRRDLSITLESNTTLRNSANLFLILTLTLKHILSQKIL